MKTPSWLDGTWIAAELRPASFQARSGDNGVDLPVERGADGRLTPESAAGILAAVKDLVGGKSWLSRVKIICAIGSRGLILRPLTLPAAPPTEVLRLLQLQIESEFPLPPESLAWGWIPLPTTSMPGRQEVLVAAVKKEVVEELAALFKPISADLSFTPATLARTALVPADAPSFAILDVAPTQCELTLREAGAAPSVRLLPWGESRLADLANAAPEGINRLVELLPATALKVPLWISGSPAVASQVAQFLQAGRDLHLPPADVLAVPTGLGQTAAIAGIVRSRIPNGVSSTLGESTASSSRGLLPLLDLRSKPAEVSVRGARALPRRPIAIAAALLAAVLLFPYVEALVFQPSLARRVSSLKSGSTQLVTIDREFSFLRYLEQNQAPHLDATFVIAQAAPQGARVESLNMNRQGEVSIAGWLRDLAQVGDFRLKLINSGFFSTVVVEDQSPTPDRQRINFRITARWKDASEREALTLGPELPDPSAAKPGASNVVASPSGPPRPPPMAPK